MTSATTPYDDAPLACVGRREETPDTASFVLARPNGTPFSFLPGQFLSVGVDIDARRHWRAYSISSSPTAPDTVSITVRRVAGGLVSNWLLDHLQPGMALPALAPAGEFALPPGPLPRHLVLLSSGCGITPMMAMARWLLDTDADCDIHFVHSARDEENFIFRQDVLTLADRHPRFKLHVFLTRPRGGLACQHGRLDAARLQALLPPTDALRAYLCGQTGYMTDVADWLRAAGVADDAIVQEDFAPICSEAPTSDERFRLEVPSFGKTAEIAVGELLLDVLEREGLPIIGACRTGVCGSCKCRLVDGEVDSASALPLTPEEQAAGYVLACSSRARGDLAVELG